MKILGVYHGYYEKKIRLQAKCKIPSVQIPADISLIPKMREVTFEKNLRDKEGKIKEEPIDEDIIILDDSDSPKKTRQNDIGKTH